MKGVQACRLPAPECSKPSCRPFPRKWQHLSQPHAPAIFFNGVQACRLPAPECSKPSRKPFPGKWQHLSQPHAPAICFEGRSSLPFARPRMLQTLPQAFPRQLPTPLAATCPSHLFLRVFKPDVCPPPNAPNPPAGLSQASGNNSRSHMPRPSVLRGVQAIVYASASLLLFSSMTLLGI